MCIVVNGPKQINLHVTEAFTEKKNIFYYYSFLYYMYSIESNSTIDFYIVSFKLQLACECTCTDSVTFSTCT